MKFVFYTCLILFAANAALFAQKTIDTTGHWELGYDIMPNLKTLTTGKAAASMIIKRYGKAGLNPFRFKLLFSGSNIDSEKSDVNPDTSGYTDSHGYILEARLGKEWSKSLLSKRAKVFWGADVRYKTDYTDATVYSTLLENQNSRKSNQFSYGISPFIGVSYAISKGLAITIESHINLYRTGIKRSSTNLQSFDRTVNFRQKGFDYNFNAIDMLYLSVRF